MRTRLCLSILSIALLIPAAGLAFAQARPASTNPLVGVSTNATLGKILVNNVKATSVNGIAFAKGFTLYHLEGETTGSFICTKDCMDLWLPLLLPKGMSIPKGTKGVTDKLGVVKRNLGVTTGEQVTYDGWPLYFYSLDKKPGDTKGNDFPSFNSIWYAVPATPMVTFQVMIAPDSTWGVVSLKYTYHGKTYRSSCAKNTCYVKVHAGAKVTLTEKPTSPTTWPFSGWKAVAAGSGSTSASKKSSFFLTSNDDYGVTATYVLK